MWLLGAKGHRGSPEPPCRAVQGLTRSGKDPTPTSPPHRVQQTSRKKGRRPPSRSAFRVPPCGVIATSPSSEGLLLPHVTPSRTLWAAALRGLGPEKVACAEEPAHLKPEASVDPQREARPAVGSPACPPPLPMSSSLGPRTNGQRPWVPSQGGRKGPSPGGGHGDAPPRCPSGRAGHLAPGAAGARPPALRGVCPGGFGAPSSARERRGLSRPSQGVCVVIVSGDVSALTWPLSY